MTFNEKIKQHLGHYKQKKYPNLPNGKWKKKRYNHLFRIEDGYLNLIEQYRDSFYKGSFSDIKKHICFHHLNSSQAMCINFFYPLMVEKQLGIILDFLGFNNEQIDYSTAVFEKESGIDSIGGHRPTNFDFYFKTSSSKEFFFEIKYTEQDFGKAINDKEHTEKYEAVYKDNMNVIEPYYSEKETFFQNYQIIRNLIHIAENSYVVFLYPKDNKKIRAGASIAKNEILKISYKSHFYDIHWEDILKFTMSKVSGKDINAQLNEFEKKYMI